MENWRDIMGIKIPIDGHDKQYSTWIHDLDWGSIGWDYDVALITIICMYVYIYIYMHTYI
jgi:hypothetical protein